MRDVSVSLPVRQHRVCTAGQRSEEETGAEQHWACAQDGGLEGGGAVTLQALGTSRVQMPVPVLPRIEKTDTVQFVL